MPFYIFSKLVNLFTQLTPRYDQLSYEPILTFTFSCQGTISFIFAFFYFIRLNKVASTRLSNNQN